MSLTLDCPETVKVGARCRALALTRTARPICDGKACYTPWAGFILAREISMAYFHQSFHISVCGCRRIRLASLDWTHLTVLFEDPGLTSLPYFHPEPASSIPPKVPPESLSKQAAIGPNPPPPPNFESRPSEIHAHFIVPRSRCFLRRRDSSMSWDSPKGGNK